MAMREWETLITYCDKYWEMFNEIDNDFDDVAIRTFKVLEKIQNEPYFKWPNKMLVKEGRLKQFLYHPNGQGGHSSSVSQGKNSSMPHLGTINVIFAAPDRTGSCPTRVMSVSRTLVEESNSELKRIEGNTPPILGFSEEDKIETIQPHDDALVVTLRIGART
ncbi:uncharacterized protein LOC142609088 [Castanea sativa]|uniref:uncharacterized protein LOC142609088 n=1 Tax=Castanea sativa TaxID=21020 RepID=UPI003F64C3FC